MTRFVILTFATSIAVNRQVPKGGVTKPMHTATHMQMPKWRALMPTALQMGRKMGMVISMMGVASMRQPITSSTAIMMKYSTARLSEMLMSTSRMIWGTRA